MENFPLKRETFQIIGLCMEVQKNLGFGFSEIVYKDAMEAEFIAAALPYTREAGLKVSYKGKELKHKFFTDFMCFEGIIVEVKASDTGIANDHIYQTLNYLNVSGNTIGLIINFGKRKLEYKRIISSDVESKY
ncbi:MAG TPA: GxxExxY protein [Chitinophagaceae bacterium]|nr:GxxExxY protein [Chitinophagaceae bacterium]